MWQKKKNQMIRPTNFPIQFVNNVEFFISIRAMDLNCYHAPCSKPLHHAVKPFMWSATSNDADNKLLV